MKKNSVKHTNKNTMNSSNGNKLNNTERVKKVTKSVETTKPAGKASRSKLDGLITTKSNKKAKQRGRVVQQEPLSKDVSRSSKLDKLATPTKLAKRPSTAVERASSTHSKQHVPVSNEVGECKPIIIMGIDKAHCVALVNELQLERAIDVALQLVKTKEMPMSHRSIKSDNFRHKFVFACGSHTPSKPCQVVLKMKANKPKMNVQFEFDLNPNNMTETDVAEFICLWQALFGVHARELAQQVGIMRIDINADCPYRTDDLIIDMDGALVGQKYFVKTNRGAELQSNYSGSTKSDEHLAVYDKNAQEAFMEANARNADYQEEAHEDDALIHLAKMKGGERTRVEMRRVFDYPRPPVSKLSEIADPFGRVRIYHIDDSKAKGMSVEFIAYLDCVRVRGVNGAGRYLLKKSSEGQAAKQKVQEFERRLGRLAAPWWRPEDFNASVMDLLKATPFWRFLQPIKKTKALQK